MRKPAFVDARRIDQLPVLPVFFKLEGRGVLVAGGDEAAAWKVELLAAAGARVRVYCETPSLELEMVKQQHPNRIEIVQRKWNERDFTDVGLAIGAFESEAEAGRFAHAARASGTPANVIDKPEYCDFQFGSIVNRAPIVVAISTDGAAPVLGQAIRRRIETILPPGIKDWAKAAKELRPRLGDLLPDLVARKAFWRRFADVAFKAPSDQIEGALNALLSGRHESRGRVTLVGAGPGDAEYLTLKAVRALQSADIILFDDLVSDDVLDLARREAKRMLVGKRGGRVSCKQDDINDVMLRLARQGKHVVRLKSGDPMIFGRAGEEIDMLEAAGVEVEVAPGVTAALAAAARLKTSLTHRDCAQGVKFITAHSRNGRLPDIDWKSAADPDITLMVYMGARKAPEFAQRLLAEGLSPQTPVVVATAVSRPTEDFAAMTLETLTHADLNPKDPILIGVGSAFGRVQRRMREIATPAMFVQNAATR